MSYVSQGGVWDTISGIGKTVGSTVLNVYGEQKKAEGANAALAAQMAAQQMITPSGLPSWLLPVAIGGVGLVVVMMLLKKSAPRQNPSRRRRRKRPGRRRRNSIVWGNVIRPF